MEIIVDFLLKSYKITDFVLTNRAMVSEKHDTEVKYNYNVRYLNGNICRGELVAEIKDKKNPEAFGVRAVIVGVFEIKETNIPKEKAHIETFKELFPIIRATVSAMTAASGMPALNLPPINMESQSIYRVDLGNIKRGMEEDQ